MGKTYVNKCFMVYEFNGICKYNDHYGASWKAIRMPSIESQVESSVFISILSLVLFIKHNILL